MVQVPNQGIPGWGARMLTKWGDAVSLRAKMTASFAGILAVPLIVAIFVVHGTVRDNDESRLRASLSSRYTAATALIGIMQDVAAASVRQIGHEIAARPDAVKSFIDPQQASFAAARMRGGLSLVALVKPDGHVAGLAEAEPSFPAGSARPPFVDIVEKRPNGWAVLSDVQVQVPCGRGCVRLAGSVVGGFWLDRSFLVRLDLPDSDITLIVNGVASVSTTSRAGALVAAFTTKDVSHRSVAGRDLAGVRGPLTSSAPGLEILVTGPDARDPSALVPVLIGLFLLALLAGIPLAYLIARHHTRPIDELASAALAVSRGEFTRHIDLGSHDEIGQLGEAFNTMTDRLRSYVGELEASRDEIRRSVRRLGETLQSTHDLTRLLSVVLETAMVAVQGRAGAVYLVGATRNDIYVKVGRGLGSSARRRMLMGEGIAGTVARERRSILIPNSDPSLRPAESEPEASTVICVPLESQGQLIGAMALYGRDSTQPFGATELETIRSLAQQASVGIENVLLHQEAQRLSITDGLTGAWNYRYFQMRLSQEVERAIRFGRSFSMMVIDIDHFKRVNDTFGHQRGDSVLIEVARRMVGVVRVQVDTLARYGGEEFVLILPETALDGAKIVAEKIRESIGGEPIGHEGEEPVHVTVSIGLATFPDHGTTPRGLIRAADQAMYEAKARGRNQVVTCEELDHTGAADDSPAEGAPPVAGDALRSRIDDQDSTPPGMRP
ncbi:MAG: diguanylate cyclase [Actinomycetota bacterium]|nr:diguanylate cyclase [Actinomycetota bacterium]